ncbi:HAD family hydrolase [Streptomyces sp. QTS52]
MSTEPTFERLVFCDVDDTVIRCTSATEFLRYYLAARHGRDGALRADEFLADLYGQIARGLPREEANRAYHRIWRGHQLAELEVWARKWYAERSAAADFYIASTTAELRRHQAEGAAVALVSGSFPPLLGPVAEAVGARFVLCGRLERCGRVLTGRLEGPPAIGEGKRVMVRELLARYPHIDPADCYAYGDHPSDRPMLRSVGHPLMVAPDGTLSPAVC